MVADFQSQQHLFQWRRELTGTEQQRSRLVGKSVDDFGAIGKRKPVMKRDVRTRFYFGDANEAHEYCM
jgi:hypothetical protein